MTLSEKSRSAIYQGLAAVVHDEEAIEEMLSHFPAREVEELVTKDFLRAELAEVRGDLRTQIAEVRADLHEQTRRLVLWLVTTLIATTSLVIAAMAAMR